MEEDTYRRIADTMVPTVRSLEGEGDVQAILRWKTILYGVSNKRSNIVQELRDDYVQYISDMLRSNDEER